jgi:hypothetical protein
MALPVVINTLVKLFDQILQFPLVLYEPADLIIATLKRLSQLACFFLSLVSRELAHDHPLARVLKLQNAGFFGLNHSGDLTRASELLLKHQNLGGLQIYLLVESLQVGL